MADVADTAFISEPSTIERAVIFADRRHGNAEWTNGSARAPSAPVYFLPTFTLKDDWGTHVEAGGRFRLKEETLKEAGSWRWEANPFVGTKPYQGLLVLLMMFNSTDAEEQQTLRYMNIGKAISSSGGLLSATLGRRSATRTRSHHGKTISVRLSDR